MGPKGPAAQHRTAGASRSSWLRGLLAAIIAVVLVRLALNASSATERPTRWMNMEKVEALNGEDTHDKIVCPRRDGSGGTISKPRGEWDVPERKEAVRVFLYAVIGSTAEAQAMLPHFLDFYLNRGGIPARNVAVTFHEPTEGNPRTKEMQKVLDKAGVYYDMWAGTFTSETKAFHRDRLISSHLDPEDWVVVADIDELHQFPGLDSANSTRTIAEFLSRVEQEQSANYVIGVFEDRVAYNGELKHVVKDKPIQEQFPLKCSMKLWTRPPSGWMSWVLPAAESNKVVAHKAHLAIHRSAHYVKSRSYLSSIFALFRFDYQGYAKSWPRLYSERLRVEHYKWVAGLVPYLIKRVRTYEKCGMLWSYESASIVTRLEQYRGRICTTCGELACSHAAPHRLRRVAVITSVWDEHVDGVSITMNRVARFLHRSPSFEVMVVTPHDPAVPHPVVNDVAEIPKLAGDSLPIFALIGRNDYVVGMPLADSQKRALEEFDAEIYHLVSPDMLGFSAQRWVREIGGCSVCSYHTQIDRYVRYYTAKHSLLDHLKPRIAIQKLFGNFYGGCDVVAAPNEAVAAKLVAKMGIPRSKIGFFPRGVNTTQYNPGRRDDAWRLKHLDARPKDVVILWAARLVKEKGAVLFAESIEKLFSNSSYDQNTLLNKTRIMVVGDGPERAFMVEKLPEKITYFMGHVSGEDLFRAYACSDIYFFPSHTEAFPNTLMEAQASGLTVLVPAYSVNRELVAADSGVLLDEHADANDFADGLNTLIMDPAMRARMSKRAVEAASHRTWDQAFGDLVSCYDRCAAIKKARATPASTVAPVSTRLRRI